MKVYREREDEDAHRSILQHIRDNKEANHAAPDVHLVELRNTAVAACDRDVLERDVQVVFRYIASKIT